MNTTSTIIAHRVDNRELITDGKKIWPESMRGYPTALIQARFFSAEWSNKNDEITSNSVKISSETPEGQEITEQGEGGAAAALVKTGTALYVAMPRPFVFNVPGSTRDRLVEIKVQLMLRGSDNEEQAKMHIPLIEGTLLKTFSAANADDLVTDAGKTAIRDIALKEVQKTMLDVSGNQTVEDVLFTGFVMQ